MSRHPNQYLKPDPTALKRIKHIVVLMLENRSFDNLLGWLYDDEPPPRAQRYAGLHRDLWNPLNIIDADGIEFIEKVYVRKNGEPIGRRPYGEQPADAPNFRQPDPDPGEGFRNTNQQLFGFYDVPALYPPEPVNMGFVNNYKNALQYGAYSFGDAPADPRTIMSCYTPEQTPVLSTLARQFAVCDHWHCSVPSQTLPNRDFVHAATSTGFVNNHPESLCDARTIFNQLQDAIDDGHGELSWRVYAGAHKNKLFSLTRLIMTQLHDRRFDGNFKKIDQFYLDAKNGKLPSYSFLEPQLSGPGQNDQHPNADIRPGEQLIADVYNAVVNSPQWNETLLVITYDEHGGCYDHVPPPNHATPPSGGKYGDPGQDGFRFNRYGVRVPTVVVSPWIEAGTIARPAGWTPYDHCSIIATVRRTFGLKDPLTKRDEYAPDLSGMLGRTRARRDKPKVKPLPYKALPEAQVNDLHRIVEMVLEKLTNTSRPDEQKIVDYVHQAYEAYFRSAR